MSLPLVSTYTYISTFLLKQLEDRISQVIILNISTCYCVACEAWLLTMICMISGRKIYITIFDYELFMVKMKKSK